jgi:hypothetical protein
VTRSTRLPIGTAPIQYPSVTSFALDYTGNTTGAKDWTTYTQTVTGNPLVSYTIKDVGVYLQDQWQATHRLSVTLGARYEYSFAPPAPATNPLFPQTGIKYHEGSLNLMPRIGVAYRATDKTVLRAGLGAYFARLVAGLLDVPLTGKGMYQVADTLTSTNPALLAAGPVFPGVLTAPVTGLTSGASTFDVFASNLKMPCTIQTNATIEHQLSNHMVLTISGIFSRGANLYGTQDINAPALGAPFTYIDNASGTQVGTYTTPIYTGAGLTRTSGPSTN